MSLKQWIELDHVAHQKSGSAGIEKRANMKPLIQDATTGRVLFWCLGCDMAHPINVGDGPGPRWSFNGSFERPTFQPSVLVRFDRLSEEGRAKDKAFHAEHGRNMTHQELPYDIHHVCHSFVTDGRIQYLSDCTHALAGQTIDLPDWDWDNTP